MYDEINWAGAIGEIILDRWWGLVGRHKPWRKAVQRARSAGRYSIPAAPWLPGRKFLSSIRNRSLDPKDQDRWKASFTATLLPVGTYTVSVATDGFQEGKFVNVAVRVTETTRMEAKLRTQAVQEKVEVQGLVQAVDTSTATTGQAIDARTIRDLPLATQNFQQLLTLSAGTNSDLNASASLGRGDVHIQVNGQREDNNNYLIEGISAPITTWPN